MQGSNLTLTDMKSETGAEKQVNNWMLYMVNKNNTIFRGKVSKLSC